MHGCMKNYSLGAYGLGAYSLGAYSLNSGGRASKYWMFLHSNVVSIVYHSFGYQCWCVESRAANSGTVLGKWSRDFLGEPSYVPACANGIVFLLCALVDGHLPLIAVDMHDTTAKWSCQYRCSHPFCPRLSSVCFEDKLLVQ
jgi:hypothetical protein